MRIFWAIIGMLASVAVIKYRERIGDMIGDASWMQVVGGVYNFLILAAIFMFFFCIAAITGTTDFLLAPLWWLLPFGKNEAAPTF